MSTVVYYYRAGQGLTTVTPDDVDQVRAAIDDPSGIVWISTLGDDPIATTLTRDVLRLHPLTVEDIVSDLPLPKIEDFGSYLYLAAHGVDRCVDDPASLETVELDIVLGARFVFTHQNRPMRSVDAVRSELERGCHLFEKGAAWVVHALLDHLIDHYLPLMDAFDDAVDDVETEAVTNPTRKALQRIFALKRSLMKLRRVAVHQREILLRLSRDEFPLVPTPLVPFFRDVFDHFTRVADLCDSYRELVSGALDAYLTTTSNRMNEIMKVLTAIATVMLPLTFIAGVYGMNFENMPELKWRYGYPFALVLMLVVAAGFVVYFRRRRWF